MRPRFFPTCPVCGDRIGIYEPAVVVDHNAHHETSLVNEPHFADGTGPVLAHAACAPLLPQRVDDRSAA